MMLDDLAYAADEIRDCCRRRGNAFRRLCFRHVGSVLNRFADCSSIGVVALALAVAENKVESQSVYV
jgi:hypothetical protein